MISHLLLVTYYLSYIYCLFCQLPLLGLQLTAPNFELGLKCIFIIDNPQESNSDGVLPEVSLVPNTQNKRFRCMWKRDVKRKERRDKARDTERMTYYAT